MSISVNPWLKNLISTVSDELELFEMSALLLERYAADSNWVHAMAPAGFAVAQAGLCGNWETPQWPVAGLCLSAIVWLLGSAAG